MNTLGIVLRPAVAFLFLLLTAIPLRINAGVTIITHGLDGNVDTWITSMATNIPNYYRFLGTNFTCYEMFFYYNSGFYYLIPNRVSGGHPTTPESGEIVVKLDWRDLADGNSYNTYQIASAVTPALLNTN